MYMQMPSIEGELPSRAEVITISSKATNGKDTQKNAEFEYNKENGILHIFAKNEVDENGNIYYGKASDYDEYNILFYYDNKIDFQNEENKNINIPFIIKYQSVNKEIGLIQEKFEQEMVLEEKGDFISTEVNMGSIYNGYINSNISNETNYETEFTQDTTLYIDKLDVDEIAIEETNFFRTKNNENHVSEEIVYKKISVNKSDVLRILGIEGSLQIINSDGEILLNVDKLALTENNEITVDLENVRGNLFIKTTKPINKGIIRIASIKAIDSKMKDTDNQYVVTAQKLTGTKITEVAKEEQNEQDENLENVENETQEEKETQDEDESQNENEITTENITEKIIENVSTDYSEIQEAVTKVKTNLDNREWTNSIQNNVNITATLVTSSEKYSLFKNPVIEMELPENVEKVVLGESYLLNANGLSIQNIEVIDKENGKKGYRKRK